MRSGVLRLLLPLLVLALSAGCLISSNQGRVNRLKSLYDVFEPPPLSGLNSTRTHPSAWAEGCLRRLISIWLIQTLADQRKGQNAEETMKSIRSVIRHEPELETIYMLACFVMMNDMQQPDKCQEINLTGLRAIPDSWRLATIQGYVEYFKMKDPAKAAGFFALAGSRPRSPPFIVKLAKRLATENVTEEEISASLELMSTVQEGDSPLKKLIESISQAKQTNP